MTQKNSAPLLIGQLAKLAGVKTDTASEGCCRVERGKRPTANSLCPRCGQTGRAVPPITLKHHVKPEHLNTVEHGPFYFCRTPACEVV